MEWTIPAFAFPAEAGPHLLTLEGWNAKLAMDLDSELRVVDLDLEDPSAGALKSTF